MTECTEERDAWISERHEVECVFIHSFIVHETDRVYNHDVEDKNIISVVGSLAIAGRISLLSNAIKLHKNKM